MTGEFPSSLPREPTAPKDPVTSEEQGRPRKLRPHAVPGAERRRRRRLALLTMGGVGALAGLLCGILATLLVLLSGGAAGAVPPTPLPEGKADATIAIDEGYLNARMVEALASYTLPVTLKSPALRVRPGNLLQFTAQADTPGVQPRVAMDAALQLDGDLIKVKIVRTSVGSISVGNELTRYVEDAINRSLEGPQRNRYFRVIGVDTDEGMVNIRLKAIPGVT